MCQKLHFFELSFRSREIDVINYFQTHSFYIKVTSCLNNRHFVILPFSFYLLEIHINSSNSCGFMYDNVLTACGSLSRYLSCLSFDSVSVLNQFIVKVCGSSNRKFVLGLPGTNKSAQWVSRLVSSVWRQILDERL